MYRSGGDNTFMPDTDDPQMPGKVGLQVVGGIVEHLAAMTAIGSSTVNSYRRLVGYRLLGADLCRLGFPEPHDRPCASPRQGGSSTAPWTRW